jgi:hypothetical protein
MKRSIAIIILVVGFVLGLTFLCFAETETYQAKIGETKRFGWDEYQNTSFDKIWFEYCFEDVSSGETKFCGVTADNINAVAANINWEGEVKLKVRAYGYKNSDGSTAVSEWGTSDSNVNYISWVLSCVIGNPYDVNFDFEW